MDRKQAKIRYRGSLFWLIFWCIFFFPIALLLFFTKSSFQVNQATYHFDYSGSRFWLCFWLLVFFPITILLLCINGFTIDKESP